MASYYGHLTFSSVLGAAYGAAAAYYLHLDWAPVFLGAGLTAVGGLLPDLDSDSGVPVRELFGLSAVVVPLFVLRWLWRRGVPGDEMLVLVGFSYILIRYVLSGVFKRLTVHRGMFHSIPGMLIAGLVIFHLDKGSELAMRLFFTGGVMLGFLSHLVLDELCSVDFNGIKLTLNKYAGSALKLTSPSRVGTLTCYSILAALVYITYREMAH